jgi:hypothetical protein
MADCQYTDPTRCGFMRRDKIACGYPVNLHDGERHPFTPAHLPVVCGECGQVGRIEGRTHIVTGGSYLEYDSHGWQPAHRLDDGRVVACEA